MKNLEQMLLSAFRWVACLIPGMGRTTIALALLAMPFTLLGQAPEPTVDEKIKSEVARQLAEAEAARWKAGINPMGGGVFIKSPDGKAYFRLYGYAQPQFTWTDGGQHLGFGNTDFRVRRARIDFSVDYDDRFKLFIEFDGAPADGTALVEGYVQAALQKDRHYIRLGKYISPFSSENLRSSRAMDTVERYIALNSLFGLPAIDVQFGAMLWGAFDKEKRFNYLVGVFNGNSSAGAAVVNGVRGNARDNNAIKDFQARFNVKATKEFTVGAAYDVDVEDTQTLQISSYAGAKFIAATVKGKRQGVDLDGHYKKERCSFDVEWLRADFKDSDAVLHGGYAQAGYWVSGSEAKGGVQGILRGEYAQIDGAAVDPVDGKTLVAATLGANVWFNGWTRLQVNAIAEHVNGNGNGTLLGGSTWRPTLLTQLQVKF
ncbi:MAG: porin [Thermoanaerobaculia bacterium]